MKDKLSFVKIRDIEAEMKVIRIIIIKSIITATTTTDVHIQVLLVRMMIIAIIAILTNHDFGNGTHIYL